MYSSNCVTSHILHSAHSLPFHHVVDFELCGVSGCLRLPRIRLGHWNGAVRNSPKDDLAALHRQRGQQLHQRQRRDCHRRQLALAPFCWRLHQLLRRKRVEHHGVCDERRMYQELCYRRLRLPRYLRYYDLWQCSYSQIRYQEPILHQHRLSHVPHERCKQL